MRVAREFTSYNHRRYSKPWMYLVTGWPIGRKPTIKWGHWIGDSESGGEVEIDAAPGDVVRYGQRDHRGNQTVIVWGLIEEDGSIASVTPQEARHAFIANQKEDA